MSWLEHASFRRRLMREEYPNVSVPRWYEHVSDAISDAKNKSLHKDGAPHYVFGPEDNAWVVWWEKTVGGFSPRLRRMGWQQAMNEGQFTCWSTVAEGRL